ncbi:MAG: IS1380 family transposase, partial [Candidatus Aminicenantes bacterium]|nr:IS1380 family transposase [Candidatus Aminicenantes bacterium]
RRPVVKFHDFKYRAASWQKKRRVVAKVEWHSGDLFPRVGFILTNMSAETEGVVRFYNGRGIAEQWIKEGKYAFNWTRLSCKHFLSNQVRLGLFVLAYNLGNFLRRLVLPGRIKHWSLRTLLVKLIKIGAKVLRHSRYVIFQMAEVAIRKELFAEILSRINQLRCYSLQ